VTKLKDKTIISQVPARVTGYGSANIDKGAIDAFVQNKGYDVVFEKAIKCACIDKESKMPLSSCKNCGGVGWIFVNPTKTRMLLTSMNVNPKFIEQGISLEGTVSITSRDVDRISFMDKITILNGEGECSQVIFPSMLYDKIVATTIYNIKKVYYLGLFISDKQPLKRLVEGEDFIVQDNAIILDKKYGDLILGSLSLSVRYTHSPVYHVFDVARDTFVTNVQLGGVEKTQSMPIHAIGKRAELIKELENFKGNRLFDNSFDITC